MAVPEFGSGYESDFLPDAVPYGATHGEEEQVRLTASTWEDFAAVEEEAAESLMGDEDTCCLPAGGTVVLYGKGGAGKTTLEVDWLAHLGAGDPWLGLEIGRPIRVLAIENEGPRYKFREKIKDKIDSWEGSELGGRCSMLEDPWAVFSFRRVDHLSALAYLIEEQQIDLLAAGPINRLGMKGGGTPDEVGEFIAYLESLRQMLERPLACMFAHHDNKAGDVSGAWEGIPDTLVHVKAIGPGQTLVHWEKVRWGSDLHQQTWTLAWDENRGYTKMDKEVRSDSDIEAEILVFVHANPACGARQLREGIEGQADRIKLLRDRMLMEGKLENRGSSTRMALWTSGSVDPVDPPAWIQGFSERDPNPVDGLRVSGSPDPLISGDPLMRDPHNERSEDLDFGGRNGDDGDLPF